MSEIDIILFKIPYLNLFCWMSSIFIGSLSGIFLWFQCAAIVDGINIDIIQKYLWMPIVGIIVSLVLSLGWVLSLDKTDLAIMLGWDAINSDSVQEVIEILKERIR